MTSPTSFLGAWTCLSLLHLGAQVFAFTKSPAPSPNLFDLANLGERVAVTYGDTTDEETLRSSLDFAQADVVLHLGEFGLLSEGNQRPREVISKSILSTSLLMDLLRETASVRSIVVVGSDKVYARSPDNSPALEEDKIGAEGIFPTAKLCSELIALSYRHSFFNPEKYNKHKVALATARVGASIGGGDFVELSLIPQAIQSLINKSTMEVRHPHSVRPWIHVLDQVAGVLQLAQALFEKGPKLAPTYNLGAQEYYSVQEVLNLLASFWGGSSLDTGDMSPGATLSFHGRLNSDLAERDLNWRPRWNLPMVIERTALWYQEFYSSQRSSVFSRDLIDFFG